MEEEYITSLIESRSQESLSFETKMAFPWVNQQVSMGWVQAHVIKGILGFTNTEKGGLLLIGVNDDGKGNREFTGLKQEHLASYQNLEAIQECIDRYADGPLSYTIKLVPYNEQIYVAVSVNEFRKMPVLCSRDFEIEKPNGKKEYILRTHDLYVRSRKGRFGTIKATNLEMQEVISLAHSKDEERLMRLLNSVSGQTISRKPKTSQYEELDRDL